MKNLAVLQTFKYLIIAILLSLGVAIGWGQRLKEWQLLVVESDSMTPALRKGTLIGIRHQTKYEEQDIITYKSPVLAKILVTHRIQSVVEKEGQTFFTTKGDANSYSDILPVSPSSIKGKTVITIPYIGFAISSAQKPLGAVIFIVIPSTILIYEELRNLVKNSQLKVL